MTAFHAAFDRTLRGEPDALSRHLRETPDAMLRFAVYANTTTSGRIDALAANYPTVVAMVGIDWFQAAGSVFVRNEPGSSAVLVDYGAGFADWLARFLPARPYPYLAPCARLDRAWTEAHVAPDAVRRPAREDEDLVLHPSVRIFSFDWNAPSLWLAHRFGEAAPEGGLEWRPEPEKLLIHRPDLAVVARRLDAAEWMLLKAARRGLSLFQAIVTSAPAAPRDALTRAARDLTEQGAFVPRTQGNKPDDHQ